MVYERLYDSILNGQLKRGEVYNEQKLADELGVSRTPVREALKGLSVLGLVTSLPRRGVLINAFDGQELAELYELRLALEMRMVERIAKSPQDYDLSKAIRSMEQQCRALAKNDIDLFIQYSRQFHFDLIRVLNNRRIETVLENTWNMTKVMAQRIVAAAQNGQSILEEHQVLLDSLLSGQVAQAREALTIHLDNSLASNLAYYQLQSTAQNKAEILAR